MIEIVAELSANHAGSLDIAVKTIKAAKASGADTIKAQAYTPDNIAVRGVKIKSGSWKGRDYYDLYTEAMTPFEWFPVLKRETEKLGMSFFASAFDFESVDMLEKLGVARHKVASFEITDIPLIEYMASKGKPMIISTGIADTNDIILAEKAASNVPVTLLICTSSYPTPPDKVDITRMLSHSKVGLSDHSKGIIAPVLAVAFNPELIERHFILDKSIKTVDSFFSSDPKEFKEMVDAVRVAEKMVKPNDDEPDKSFARSLWVVKDIKAGEIFTKENIKSLRPNLGLHPKLLSKILGSKAPRNYKAPCPLSF